MAPRTLLTAKHLRGRPGLSRAAAEALLSAQPLTVLDALRIRGVGRKTTRTLLELGLLDDPDNAQRGTPPGIIIRKS